MLHKNVETGKEDDKCNNLLIVMRSTKIFIFFLSFKLGMLITTIGVITIGTGMLGTIFEIKNCFVLKRTSVFIERTRDNTYLNSSFLNVNHA